jgi:hypothetical protein
VVQDRHLAEELIPAGKFLKARLLPRLFVWKRANCDAKHHFEHCIRHELGLHCLAF